MRMREREGERENATKKREKNRNLFLDTLLWKKGRVLRERERGQEIVDEELHGSSSLLAIIIGS